MSAIEVIEDKLDFFWPEVTPGLHQASVALLPGAAYLL